MEDKVRGRLKRQANAATQKPKQQATLNTQEKSCAANSEPMMMWPAEYPHVRT
jgi:hypothetical protein